MYHYYKKMIYENSQKFSTKFYCEKCDYYANRKSDLIKHFNSKKHNGTYKMIHKNSQLNVNVEKFINFIPGIIVIKKFVII